MIYLLFGLVALAAFLWLGRALTRVSPAAIAQNARFGGVVVLVGLAALLMLTGRFHMVSQVMALAGQAMRYRRAFSRAPGFDDVDDASAASGDQTAVRTRYLEMTLDQGTGAIDGRFIDGPLAGQPLSGLDQATLVGALQGTSDDPESVRVLEAYLDRTFAGWREDHHERARARSTGTADAGGMGEDEAYEILGLQPGADADAIRSAHRRLMANIHPDRGGSTYLAAQVNLAKEVLLKLHG